MEANNAISSSFEGLLRTEIILIICLLYILRGGFKLSIITDKYQFIIIAVLMLVSLILILGNLEINSFELIKENSPNLVSSKYLPNYTVSILFRSWKDIYERNAQK